MTVDTPRFVVAGLSGDGGKTLVTLSAVAALRARGLSVSTFKKGPDYIDPAWLGVVGGSVCRNLDTYLVEPDRVLRSFVNHAADGDVAVVEGNRGLFDGRDVYGSHSTAELSRLLCAPAVLVVDARKATRTVAALVKGCVEFEPDVRVAGVVLNRVAGGRHLRILRESIAEFTGVPVVGALPNFGRDAIPGRHLGLVPPSEFDPEAGLDATLREAADHLDIDAILAIAATAGPLRSAVESPRALCSQRARVGYFRDNVFTFYYPENLEALEAAGATLVPVSSLDDARLPPVDALYIGGGFPETHAQRLADNRSMMSSVRAAAISGLPVYAECGGLIYLARSLHWGDAAFPMAGVFPLDLEMHERPVGHGYTLARVDRRNAFYPAGTTIFGHEFHYTGPRGPIERRDTCMTVATGSGLGDGRDGLVTGNTLASYTHIHASGNPGWAEAIVDRAIEHTRTRADMITVERHATWQK